MPINEKYLARLVLRYLDDLRGIPQTFEELTEHVRGRLQKPCEHALDRILQYFCAAEYAKRCEATADAMPQWKITAKGSRQINKCVPEEELDRMIWD